MLKGMLEPQPEFFECCESVEELEALLSKDSESEPEGETVSAPEEWAYVVWRAPRSSQNLVGLHLGSGRAWCFIARCLGEEYSYGRGHRLRKAENLAEARRLYSLEAARHKAPRVPAVFYH